MTTALNELLPMAQELEITERAKLALHLLTSLDEPSEAEVEQLWVEEAGRRLTAYRAGDVQSISADEVFRRALDELP